MDLLVERPADGVALVVLNRPERRNALDDALLLEGLPNTFQELSEDESVRAIVLTGEGQDFCAGADLTCSGLEQPTPTASERYILASHRSPMLLRSMSKPVVAAVNGAAVGAGLGLALACDIRLAAPEARFIAPFIRMGLPPDYGTSYFLPRIAGPDVALELFLTARPVPAEEAVRLGIATRTAADVRSEGISLATQLAANSVYATTVTKRNVYRAMERSMDTAIIDNEIRAVSLALHGEDFAEQLQQWRSQVLGQSGTNA